MFQGIRNDRKREETSGVTGESDFSWKWYILYQELIDVLK